MGRGGIQSLQMLCAAVGEGGTERSSRAREDALQSKATCVIHVQGKSDQMQRMDGLERQGTLPENQ